MVAENAQIADSPQTPPKVRAKSLPLSFHVRLKVRNLYISQALGTKEIAERTGLTPKQVANLIAREKLSSIRAHREKGIENKTDARARANFEAFNSQLAEEAEEISLGALKRTREATERTDRDAPRDFQSFTGGILNLVKAARMVRGLDQRASGSGSQLQGDGVAILFVGELKAIGAGANPAGEKRAEQIADSIAVSAKEVPRH